DPDFVAWLDAQLTQAERDRLHPLERLAMRDGHPGAPSPSPGHLRPERRGEARMPIHRGEEQLSKRASIHGLNSTTKVTRLSTSVPFTCLMAAVTTAESGRVPGRSRSLTAATPAEFVRTVSFGTNVTIGPLPGKVASA